jgi:quercetin dioxygenase-like cupin family protein/catechol 2,3-dioxygenase-like lactoylglutathione lyase family enzyme
MDAATAVAARELVTEPGSGRAWWFLGTLAVLRNPEGAPRVPAVIELTVPPGGSPPEHVHDALDDSFLLLDGEVVVRCGGQTFVARPGSYVCLPHGVPHTFRVTSARPARMLLVHGDDSFLRFIEALGVPTTEHTLPPPGAAAEIDPEQASRASTEHGAPMVGAPLEAEEARAALAGAPPAGLGAVNHVAIEVTDVRRSEQWYSAALGVVRVDGEVAADGTGHVALASPSGGWVIALASGSTPAVSHVAFGCADRAALSSWRDALADRGLAPGTITDAPYGSGFVVRDPDGLEVELFAPPAGAA